MSDSCNCGSFNAGDLRSLLFAAACPVHARQVFGEPEPEIKIRSRRCGDCYFWMKSSLCPRETNVNGWNRGPSMDDWPCEKFMQKEVYCKP